MSKDKSDPHNNNSVRKYADGMMINPYTLSFPRKYERAFRDKYFADSLWQFRIAFFLLALLYGLFGFLDNIIIPEFRQEFFFIRFGVVIPFLTSVIILSYFQLFKKVWQLLLMFSFLLGGAGIAIMLMMAPDNYAYYGGMMLVLFAGFFFIKLRFLMASIAGWALLLIYNAGAVFFSDAPGELIINNNFFFIAANIIGMMGAYNIEFFTRRDYYLNKKLDARQQEIAETNRNLEQKVQERTGQLQKAKEHAEQSDKLKSAFLANMSHEIRTPMNSILGFSELLKNPQLTGDQKERFIATIEKSGERMLNLINDIVDISKIESGQMEMHKTAVNLQDSMLFLLDFFKPDFTKNKPDVQLRLNMPPERTTIRTDKEKLHSVLINLIKNAQKFTRTGVVEFGFGPGDGVLHFFVRDTGVGIPKDKQPHVFDRFYQVDTSLSSGYEGAGLGLPITKAFVELLGGNIWLESEPGKGTTFYFSLPAGAETSTQAPDKEELPGHTKDTPAKTRKVLVVEDDQASYDLIRYMLDKHTKLLHAPTGEKAIGIFKKHPDIDLILMDIKMPGIDGLETTRQIREFNKEIPIIAQTAHALTGDREKALEAGCDDYIAKPIKQVTLLQCIERNI